MVRPNFEEQTPGAMIHINNDEANRLGISKSLVAANMAMRFGSGIPLTTLWDGDYPMQVKLKAEGKQILTLKIWAMNMYSLLFREYPCLFVK